VAPAPDRLALTVTSVDEPLETVQLAEIPGGDGPTVAPLERVANDWKRTTIVISGECRCPKS
jgi:hypothetical protein